MTRGATVLSGSVAMLAVAVEVAVPGGWGEASWALLAAGLLVGVPHGAVDHLVLSARYRWARRRPVAVVVGYAAVAAAGYVLFRAFPVPGLALFVALSVWHFGTGETAFADLRAGRPVRWRPASAVVLGSVVLLLPLARPSAETTAVVAALAPGWTGPPPLLATAAVVAVVGAGVVLLASLAVRGHRWEAGEVAVLLAVALVLPPPAAVGVYFGAWHATRHVGRILAGDPASAAACAAGRWAAPLRRFARAAVLPTAAAVAALLVLRSATGGWSGFVGTALPVFAALTVPHALVLASLDRAQGQAGTERSASRRMGTCGMPSSS